MEENIKIKVAHYKCFGENPQGFEKIKPINILIGRNNSGKSSLIDVIEAFVKKTSLIKKNNFDIPSIILELPLSEKELGSVFKKDTSGGFIGDNHWMFGQKWIGKNIVYKYEEKKLGFISVDPPFNIGNENEIGDRLASNIKTDLEKKIFKRIYAERDIKSETESQYELDGNGFGATNLIQNYINDSTMPRDLIEDKLFYDLNQIIFPDSSYKNITVRKTESQRWEIFLREEGKDYIPLSQLGSGLKTIILVLIYLLILPHKENKELKEFIFAFEELENNLHPALQRRLFSYIRKFAEEKKSTFFITTHSNVVIDLFSNDVLCQIYHIQKIDENTYCTPVKTYFEKAGILDDLDIRASDLLQANGIIWVEGPSDRVYINRWIEIWSDGLFKEGIHYQCVFYGGRLLAHLTAGTEENEIKNLINILKTNRNLMLLIDSD